MTAELILPFLIARDERRVRALRKNEHLVIDGIPVEPAHRAKICLILFQIAGLEKVLDAFLDFLCQRFDLFFDGCFFCHRLLLSRQKHLRTNGSSVRRCFSYFILRGGGVRPAFRARSLSALRLASLYGGRTVTQFLGTM